jgi:hypothetical protein
MKDILTENEMRRFRDLLNYNRTDDQLTSNSKKSIGYNKEDILRLHKTKINEDRFNRGFKILISESVTEGEGRFDAPFKAGQYKDEDGSIKKALEVSLQPYIDFIQNPDPAYFGHFIKLTFEASADSSGLSPEALTRTAGLNITSSMSPEEQNKILSNARLQTILSLTKQILSEKFGVSVEELSEKVIVEGSSVVNPGVGGQYRYVKAGITKGAETIPTPPIPPSPEPKIGCDYKGQKGGKRASSPPFVGYEVSHQTSIKVGQKMTLIFDSITIPDAFYIKYGKTEKFSGFIGSDAAKYERQLADLKDQLKPAIDEKINSLGGTIKTVDEDFIPLGTPTQMLNDVKRLAEEKFSDDANSTLLTLMLGYSRKYGDRGKTEYDTKDNVFGVYWSPWDQMPGISLPEDNILFGSESKDFFIINKMLQKGFFKYPEVTEKEDKKYWNNIKYTLNSGYSRSQNGKADPKTYGTITRDVIKKMIEAGDIMVYVNQRKRLSPVPGDPNKLMFDFTFTQEFKDEYLYIVCFSPLSGTIFNVSARCS